MNKIFSKICTVWALSTLMFASCTPDEYDLGGVKYTPDQLVQGSNFFVTPDAKDPNTIHLTTNLTGVIPLWDTPVGRAQGATNDIQLPFAGEYTVKFGLVTSAGIVYGEPYTFSVTTNNFKMLEDDMWTYLTGGVGKTKKWVPCDKNYGVGKCTGPVMYCNPEDVKNDKSNITDLAFEAFAPNWDPGFESWLIPEDDPYMSSYMTFGLYEDKGCTVEEFRGDANGGVSMNGKFTFNITDKAHPVISFTDSYALHSIAFDANCTNNTNEIKILELTPYMLQLALFRDNDPAEGPWWIIWNFVSEDVKNGTVQIPKEETPLEPSLVDASEVTINNIDTLLFKMVTDDAIYQSSAVTYLINQDAPYDWMWWNGGSSKWENNNFAKNGYKKPWAPVVTSSIDEFALKLEKAADGTYKFEEESTGNTGTFTIEGNKLTFSSAISFFKAEGATRTVQMETKEVYVIKADNDNNEFYFAVPDGKDATNVVNQYLYVNLTQKAIGGAVTGPVSVPCDNTKVKAYMEADKYFRIQIYNPWDAGQAGDPPVDISKLKLKKGQKMTIKFTIGGFTFENAAKAAICENAINSAWEPNCFDLAEAITIESDGQYTLTLTNTTDAAVKWADKSTCLTIAMQYTDYATADTSVDADEKFTKITATIDSIEIE